MNTYTYKKPTMRQRRKAVRQWLVSTTFRAVLMTAVAVFGILYVVQTSSLSTKGYEISDIEKQIQVLEQDNQRLEFEIATNRSMQSIQDRLKDMNLIAMGDAKYVMPVGTAVALR